MDGQNIAWEDQKRLSEFSVVVNRCDDVQERLTLITKEIEATKDGLKELELVLDEDEPIKFKCGNGFVNVPLEEAVQELKTENEARQRKAADLRATLQEDHERAAVLKKILHSRLAVPLLPCRNWGSLGTPNDAAYMGSPGQRDHKGPARRGLLLQHPRSHLTVQMTENITIQRQVNVNGVRKDKHMCTWPGCGKTYGKRAKLIEHQRSHTNERPFRCEKCAKSFLRNSHLQRHLIIAHPDPDLMQDLKPFVCGGCGKGFALKHHLVRHAKLHSNPTPFSCLVEGCGVSFAKKRQLKSHILTVHENLTQLSPRARLSKRYACGDCGNIFEKWSLLVQHRRRDHTNLGHYACEQCGKAFGKARNLAAHCRRIHEDSERQMPSFQCDLCDVRKTFSSNSALKVHKATVHEGRKPYQCEICQKPFGHKHLLVRHLRTHQAKEPTQMGQEPQEFSAEPENLNAIERLVGADLHDRTFECIQCRRRYKRKYDLSRHVFSAHSLDSTLESEAIK